MTAIIRLKHTKANLWDTTSL